MLRKTIGLIGVVLLVIALGAVLVAPPMVDNALATVAVVMTVALLVLIAYCACTKSLPNMWIVLLLAVVVIGLLMLAWKTPEILSNPADVIATWAEGHYKLLVVLASVGGLFAGLSCNATISCKKGKRVKSNDSSAELWSNKLCRNPTFKDEARVVLILWGNFYFMWNYIFTKIISSPIHVMFSHGIVMSFELENSPNSLLLFPGTIIEVIVPDSKSAVTSWTYPNLFPLFIFITSLCLKSKPCEFMIITSILNILFLCIIITILEILVLREIL